MDSIESRVRAQYQLQPEEAIPPEALHRAILQAAIEECDRWANAMREFGFTPHPGLSMKENLCAFAEWWAKRKVAGN